MEGGVRALYTVSVVWRAYSGNAVPSAALLRRRSVARTVYFEDRLVWSSDDVGFQSFVYGRSFVCSSVEEWTIEMLVVVKHQSYEGVVIFQSLCIERDEFQPSPCWTGGVCRRCILSFHWNYVNRFVSVVCERVWMIYVLCRPFVFPAPCTAPCTLRILLILLI